MAAIDRTCFICAEKAQAPDSSAAAAAGDQNLIENGREGAESSILAIFRVLDLPDYDCVNADLFHEISLCNSCEDKLSRLQNELNVLGKLEKIVERRRRQIECRKTDLRSKILKTKKEQEGKLMNDHLEGYQRRDKVLRGQIMTATTVSSKAAGEDCSNSDKLEMTKVDGFAAGPSTLINSDTDTKIHSSQSSRAMASREILSSEEGQNHSGVGAFNILNEATRVENLYTAERRIEDGHSGNEIVMKTNVSNSNDEKEPNLLIFPQKTTPSSSMPRNQFGQFKTKGVDSTETEKKHKCHLCPAKFKRSDHLKRHLRTHSGEKSNACKLCPKTFSQINHLKRHEFGHTGDKPFECKLCSKTFAQLDRLKSHQKVHNREKPFLCKFCGKTFTKAKVLEVHENGHRGVKPFSCSVCPSSFATSGELKTHDRVHTGEKPFACKICLKAFSQSCNLLSHMRTHVVEKPVKCNICCTEFKLQSRSLKAQKDTQSQSHSESKVEQQPGQQCKSLLKDLLEGVHNNDQSKPNSNPNPKQIPAKNVPSAAASNDQDQRPSDAALTERKHGCPLCPSRFKTKGNLTQHIRVHTGERPFACQLCPKTFSLKSHLVVHQVVHTREKPFACALCDKSFGRSFQLKAHAIRAHTGDEDKPYFCQTCSKTCSRRHDANGGEKTFGGTISICPQQLESAETQQSGQNGRKETNNETCQGLNII